MSFHKPEINPALAGLTHGTDLASVAKALGYGEVTTTSSDLTQGGAASYESLESKLTEMHILDKHFEVLNKIPQTRAGQLIDEWNEVYAIGSGRGKTISNDLGGSKEGTRSAVRRYLRLKFMTTRWGINQTLLKSENFMPEMNKEDVAALTRLRQDLTWLVYEGDSRMGDDGTKGVDGGEEFDGLYAQITDDAVSGRYDGPMIFDCFTEGSGLDGMGFSNPADLEAGLQKLAMRMSQPANGVNDSPFMYMGTSVRQDTIDYTNFQPVGIQTAGPQMTTANNLIVNRFSNANTSGMSTELMRDKFLPDAQNGFFLTPQTRQEAVACVAPTVAVAVAPSDPSSRFDTGWDGNYFYFVAPFGKDISEKGYEGAAVASTVAAVAVGGKVTLTITKGTGGAEAGYLIYRSRRGGTNNPDDARLIKRIPASSGSTTTFVDLNRELPGASKAYIVNWGDAESAELRYLYAPFRIELPRDVKAAHLIPGMVSASYALRVRRHRAVGVITNVVSRSGGWSPR